ncbi:MAG: PTS sugar transporter subunit IIB [FCB group bacterium]|nr:PTS sugar transporter subunit IIB [FCB group bacterium]
MSRYKYPILRIDDRLIHGQVMLGWGIQLNLKLIILANDKAAGTPSLKNLYLSLIPPELDCKILSLKATADYLKDRGKMGKTMIITADTSDAKVLLDSNTNIKQLIIGGIHHKEGCREVLPYVYVDDNMIKELKSISDRGVEVLCQDLPGGKIYEFSKLIKTYS